MTEPDFLALWGRLRPYLARIARRLAAPFHLDPEDLMSAAAVVVWTARGQLTGPTPEPLVVTIARRAMIGCRRREMRHRLKTLNMVVRPGDRDPLEQQPGREGEPAPDEFLTLIDLAHPGDRELLLAVYRDGLLPARVAERDGVTRGAVAQRLDRALERLLDNLA